MSRGVLVVVAIIWSHIFGVRLYWRLKSSFSMIIDSFRNFCTNLILFAFWWSTTYPRQIGFVQLMTITEMATEERESCCMCCGILCRLICCPPCPHAITAKLAFQPPPQSYNIYQEGSVTQQLWIQESYMQPGKKVLFDPHLPYHLVTDIRTRRRSTLVGLYLEHPNSSLTIIFSHGNAVDLGMMSIFLVQLATQLECSIFCYDYSGYGMSSGSPSETNLYADLAAAFECVTQRFGVTPGHVILYGQSIGTAATVDFAAKNPNIGGVVLHAPLASGLRVLRPTLQRTYCCDPFPSIEKVHQIASPDQVIHFSHGHALHERCPSSQNPLWIEGADHNDVEMFPEYIDRLGEFMEDIRNINLEQG
eukprot:gene7405-9764_t